MVFTFLKARGLETGSSLVEEDQLELATKLEKIAAEKGIDFILPSDVIVADKFAADAATQTVSVDEIPEGWMGLDNGPTSTKDIQEKLSDCKTVIWNGPMGVFEFEAFAKALRRRCRTSPLAAEPRSSSWKARYFLVLQPFRRHKALAIIRPIAQESLWMELVSPVLLSDLHVINVSFLAKMRH